MNDTVKEKHFKPPIEVDKLLTLVDCLDDDKLEAISPVYVFAVRKIYSIHSLPKLLILCRLRDKCPNNYVLSKVTAESAVLKYGGAFPTCIVRPSIVISTYEEPINGWINNVYGITGIYTCCYVGLMHSVYCVKEYNAEMIPADYVISNTIAAAWDIGTRYKS